MKKTSRGGTSTPKRTYPSLTHGTGNNAGSRPVVLGEQILDPCLGRGEILAKSLPGRLSSHKSRESYN